MNELETLDCMDHIGMALFSHGRLEQNESISDEWLEETQDTYARPTSKMYGQQNDF